MAATGHLRDLRAEAESAGYVPPNPGLLAVLTMSHHAPENPGPWYRHLMGGVEIPGWEGPFRRMADSGVLGTLGRAMDEHGPGLGGPAMGAVFRPFYQVPCAGVKVVIVGQDPYPAGDASKPAVARANKLSHSALVSILGEGYEEVVDGAPWPDGQDRDDARPRVRLSRVPYAIGKSFAYPDICSVPPGSFINLEKAVRASSYGTPRMDPGLDGWARQGVLMLNACPVLCKGSSKAPNMWTAWISAVLAEIATTNPLAVFVLVGAAPKSLKQAIVSAGTESFVIETSHPSYRNKGGTDFINSKVFFRVNEFLSGAGVPPIAW